MTTNQEIVRQLRLERNKLMSLLIEILAYKDGLPDDVVTEIEDATAGVRQCIADGLAKDLADGD